MAAKLGNSMRRILTLLAIAACIILPGSCNRSAVKSDSGETDETNPLGANAACYVCHMTFVKEELSKTHLQAKVGCIDCHGISADHANDEDIGATKPDITFKRDKVDAMCLKCHHKHHITAEMAAKHKTQPICTDCHGNHKI